MVPNAETDEPPTAKDGTNRSGNKSRLINPPLVLLKMTMFLIFGATSSLIPYLTIHMQSIGLTVGEIATVYLTLLFTTCLSPPISGYIVDRFGRYKPVLLVCLVLNIVAHHSLDLIPRRQPFGLVTVQPQLSLGAADNGTISMNQPCNQAECPTMAVFQQKLQRTCFPEIKNLSRFEVIFTQSNESNRSCGMINLEQCSVDPWKNDSVPLINIQCPLSNEYDRTFWYYLLIRFFSTTMLTATVTITDPMALTMIEQHGGDFGREKLFSSIGMAIFTPSTGLLIDYFSEGYQSTNYKPAFYIYDILLGMSLISVLFLPIGKKLPSENIMKHLFKILQHPHVLVFIFFLFFLGSFWGFIESYLFVIMKEMGSPNYLLGLTYTVGTVTSIPMMYLTGPITKKVGHVNLLVVAFFAHALRILGYSFIYNPFWCFPIELNEAISCYFMWVVATTYCAVLAPNNLVATLIGVSGMIHFCLGKGIGSFVGGFMIASFGTRMAFRYMGYTAVLGGVLYKFLHMIWLKKYDKHQAVETEEHAIKTIKESETITVKCDHF
ncbi:major facilitator superfamily domain-containing protein 6-like [Topomyia yanbarensis]|uniref:major facilitator superfamily domain-containing protein 6-like n=1 Tax=Topomyia yanbarensis TaxID=2498891 RepID=UPI00273C45A2|nr:major facilitator superfamily domain-containing protein 6-like [Topomyia yanbarensis]